MRNIILLSCAILLLASCSEKRNEEVVLFTIEYTSFHIQPDEVRAIIKEKLIEAGIPAEERAAETNTGPAGYLVWPKDYDQQAHDILDKLIKR